MWVHRYLHRRRFPRWWRRSTLAFVAERVGGPDVQVVDLTPPSVESHDLELTPRQVGDIASADLVVYQKGFQPAVDDAVEQNASGIELDITEVASLDDLTGDPHVWLDPTRFAAITQEVADALGDVVPAKAGAIRGRADELVGELTATRSSGRVSRIASARSS